jgi:hypothetical protein
MRAGRGYPPEGGKNRFAGLHAANLIDANPSASPFSFTTAL